MTFTATTFGQAIQASRPGKKFRKPIDLPMGFWTALFFFARHYPYLAFDLVRYRIRLPFRRRRNRLRWEKLAATYRKAEPAPPFAEPLLLAGRISEDTGIGRACRYEVERLKAEYADVQVFDTMTADAEKIAECIARGDLRNPATVVLFGQPDVYEKLLPLFPVEFLARARRIGLWVWEMDQFPPQWRFALDIVHEIWTPSTFCANAFRKGTDLPIKVVPHAVTVPDVEPFSRSIFGLRDSDFVGLSIMDLRWYSDRKNPLAHVRAWKRAFGDAGNSTLIIKARFGKRTRYIRDLILSEIGASSNVQIIEDDLSNEDVTRLQGMADVLVSLHRAEGYGLCIEEVIMLGKHVIASEYSGSEKYKMHQSFHAVPCEMSEYIDARGTYQGNKMKWASPRIDAAAELLQAVSATVR